MKIFLWLAVALVVVSVAGSFLLLPPSTRFTMRAVVVGGVGVWRWDFWWDFQALLKDAKRQRPFLIDP